jgi:hypothetical protein
MENKLVEWLPIQFKEKAPVELREQIEDNFGLDKSDFETEENGYSFEFDAETNSQINITFEEWAGGIKVSVIGTYPWDVCAVFELVQIYCGD